MRGQTKTDRFRLTDKEPVGRKAARTLVIPTRRGAISLWHCHLPAGQKHSPYKTGDNRASVACGPIAAEMIQEMAAYLNKELHEALGTGLVSVFVGAFIGRLTVSG